MALRATKAENLKREEKAIVSVSMGLTQYEQSLASNKHTPKQTRLRMLERTDSYTYIPKSGHRHVKIRHTTEFLTNHNTQNDTLLSFLAKVIPCPG